MNIKPQYHFFHRIYLALSGIFVAFKTERHMKFHVFFGSVLLIPSIWIPISTVERVALIIMIGMLIAFELINTAIETTIDLITKQFRYRAKLAKDISSGAVLVIAILLVILGIFIYLPYVYNSRIGALFGY